MRHRRIVREGTWVIAGQIIVAAGMLAGVRLLTEVIPREQYGTVNLLLGIVLLARGLLCGPVMQAGVRMYPEAVAQEQVPRLRRVVRRLLVAGIGISAVVGAAAVACSVFWLKTPGINAVTALFIIGLLVVDTVRLMEMEFLNAGRRQLVGSAFRAADAVLRPGLIFALVMMLGSSVNAIVAGHFFAASLLFTGLRAKVGPSLAGASGISTAQDQSLRKDIIHYASPLVPLAAFSWITNLSDRYIIGGYLGAGDVGTYSATYALVSHPFLMAAGVIDLTLRPVYFHAVSVGDRAKEGKVFRAWLAATAGSCVLIFIGVILCRGLLARFLLGPAYRGGQDLMPWIAAGYVFYAIATVFEKPAYAHKETRWVPILQGAGAVACIIFEFILIRLYGLKGAAVAVPCYYGIQACLALLVSQRLRSRKAIT
jgi:O-antigen/teichoic acid export membrane protein